MHPSIRTKRDNLTPFTSETAREAAKLSALARSKEKMVRLEVKITPDQLEYLKSKGNVSQFLRLLIDLEHANYVRSVKK